MRWLLLLLAACGADDSVFDRPWRLTVVSATISDTKSDGSMWDPDDSPPDAKATLSLNGTVIGETPVVDDSAKPFWNTALNPVVIEFGDQISVDMVDDDVTIDDPIMTGCLIPMTQAVADDGDAKCVDAQATIHIAVETE